MGQPQFQRKALFPAIAVSTKRAFSTPQRMGPSSLPGRSIHDSPDGARASANANRARRPGACSGRNRLDEVIVKRLIYFGILVCLAVSAAAQPTENKLSVLERAAALDTGQYVWEPEAAEAGPLSLVINLTTQRMLVYRGGVAIAASTISSGSEGRETPTGVFGILQKEVTHRSGTYDNAPMPYMQRITSKGVAMHGGNLPGYSASHGCIRLPISFAKLLFGVTEIGTPVTIVDETQLAEQARVAAEYQGALDEVARRKAALMEDADRQLAEFERAKAAHERILRQHAADMAEYRSKLTPR